MRHALFAAAALLACQPEPPAPTTSQCTRLPEPTSTVVARVGPEAIGVNDVVNRAKEQGSRARYMYKREADIRRLLEDEVRLSLLAQAAVERGLDRDPMVIEAARRAMVRKLLDSDLGTEVVPGKDVGPSDRAVRDYYERRRDEFIQPERRRIVHIQLEHTPKGKELAASLLALLEQSPEDRNMFRTQAMRHSRDRDTRQQGGETPFLTRDELIAEFGPTFADAVFTLAPSAFAAEPLESVRGWHVVRLLGIREAQHRELDEVRDLIVERIRRSQRETMFDSYLDDIRRRHPVVIYEDRMPALLRAMKSALEPN